MRDQLVALAKLVEIDSAARDYDTELKEIPERIDEMRTNVQRLESLLSQERQQLADAEQLKASQLAEIAERNDSIAKAKAKAARARNMKEADASERELEANRRLIKEREDEIARLDEAIGKVRASLSEHEHEFEKLRTMFAEEEESARSRLAEVKQEREKVVGGRAEIAAKLPKSVVRRYEMLQSRKPPGAAMVIEGGTCTACRMTIPAQQFIELQRGTELQQCPICQRILLWPPLIED